MRRELPEGNIVAEYKFSNCTVKISDAAFRGVSEAELRRRREEANRIAWDIAVRHEIKRREAERGKAEAAREEDLGEVYGTALPEVRG